jgi:hypothetical protein
VFFDTLDLNCNNELDHDEFMGVLKTRPQLGQGVDDKLKK